MGAEESSYVMDRGPGVEKDYETEALYSHEGAKRSQYEMDRIYGGGVEYEEYPLSSGQKHGIGGGYLPPPKRKVLSNEAFIPKDVAPKYVGASVDYSKQAIRQRNREMMQRKLRYKMIEKEIDEGLQ